MTAPTVDTLFDLVTATSEAVVEARLAYFADAVDAPQVLATFTDEELLGLEGPAGRPLAPSPWLESLNEADRQTAVSAALRGLIARGAYRPEPVDVGSGTMIAHALPEVLALLSMRHHVDRVVVAERRTALETSWTVAYAQTADLWLLETVDRTGLHRFVLCSSPDAVTRLAAWCGAAADLPTPDVALALTPAEVADGSPRTEPVGRASVAVTITRNDVAGGRSERSGLFTGPQGVIVSQATPDGLVAFRGVAFDDVLVHWTDRLAAWS